MQIELNEKTQIQLNEASHYCSLPPERLAALLVQDGLTAYSMEREQFKTTFDNEVD